MARTVAVDTKAPHYVTDDVVTDENGTLYA